MCFAETVNADVVQLVVAQLQRDSEVENVSVERVQAIAAQSLAGPLEARV